MRVESFGNRKIEMRAYHGTLLSKAESILESGFRSSNGIDHWLGTGVYFFREDDTQAKFYAERDRFKLMKRGQYRKAKSPEYDGCIFEWCETLQSEEFLNLDTKDGAVFFDRHMKATKKMLLSRGYKVETALWQWNNELFNLIPPTYTVIQRTFPVPSKKHGNHSEALFNTLMFFPILKGNRDVSAEVSSTATELIHGTQVVVRNPQRIDTTKLSWMVC